jgi:hypothetical protein
MTEASHDVSVPQQVRANLLLCDTAQVVGQKLYILGGGWSYIWIREEGRPVAFALAIDLALPWDHANRQVKIVAHILTEDREEVVPEGASGPVRAEGTVVAGRSPVARPGTDLHVPLVIPFPPMVLKPSGYVCELMADGDPIASATFQVALTPTGQRPGGPQ